MEINPTSCITAACEHLGEMNCIHQVCLSAMAPGLDGVDWGIRSSALDIQMHRLLQGKSSTAGFNQSKPPSPPQKLNAHSLFAEKIQERPLLCQTIPANRVFASTVRLSSARLD